MGDVLQRIPSQFLKDGPVDPHRRLRFRVSDLFPGISRGRDTVPLEQIARQCPEFFRDRTEAPREFQVHLPLQKVVEQIGLFPARAAQTAPVIPADAPPLVSEKITPQAEPSVPANPAPAFETEASSVRNLVPALDTLLKIILAKHTAPSGHS